MENARAKSDHAYHRLRPDEMESDADGEKHIAHLADDMERKQSLGIILHQGGHGPDQDRNRSERGDDEPPDLAVGGDGQQTAKNAHKAINSQFGHRAGKGRTGRGWCRRIGIGQPVAHGQNARLGGESEEETAQNEMEQAGLALLHLRHRYLEKGERKRAGEAIEQDATDEKKDRGHMGDEKIFIACAQPRPLLVPEDDHEIGGQRHDFPKDEKEKEVGHHDYIQYSREKYQQHTVKVAEAAGAVVRDLHEFLRIEGNQEADDGDDGEKKGAEIVDLIDQGRPQARDLQERQTGRNRPRTEHPQDNGQDQQSAKCGRSEGHPADQLALSAQKQGEERTSQIDSLRGEECVHLANPRVGIRECLPL